jgi:hypothetical protein
MPLGTEKSSPGQEMGTFALDIIAEALKCSDGREIFENGGQNLNQK